MRRCQALLCCGLLALCFGPCLTGCRSKADADSARAAAVEQLGGDEESDAAASHVASPADSNGSPETTVATITSADVQQITGVAYDMSSQPADFPNLKQWEFRRQAQRVSLLFAAGETASERMENAKRVKHSEVADFRGVSIWEPVQGRLTVLDAGRCAEVVLSRDHGDEVERLKYARALATLLLEKT